MAEGRPVQTSEPVESNAAKAFRETMADFTNAVGGPKVSEDESDAGNARRFVHDHDGRALYVKPWRLWFIWDGHGYRPDNKNEIMRLAISTACAIVEEVPKVASGDAQKRRLKHALQSQNQQRLLAMLALASAQPEIAALPSQFDTKPDLLGVSNGVIDLRTGKLLGDGERHLITKRAGAAFDPDAECPVFTSFLFSVCGDNAALFDFIQCAMGYSLTGHTSEQALFVSIGLGANGKTTLHELFLDLFGEYGARTPAETLLVSRLEGSSVPNDVARLVGTRLVVATEIEQGRRLNEAKVKEITGGDTLTARFMRGEWFDFRPQFKVWLAGNHLPRIHGADHGIWRRMRLIEFGVTIAEADQDRRLPEKLRAELPGILRWAVEGAVKWYGSGLQTPEKVKDASAQYRAAEDVLGQFIAERCVLEPDSRETLKDIAERYNQWAEANSERKTSSRNLGAWLEERGYSKARGAGNAVFVVGIRLKASY